VDAAGRIELITSVLGNDRNQQVFIADENVTLLSLYGLIDLGSGFCIAWENGAFAFASVSPSFFDAGEQLFVSNRTDFRRDEVDFKGDPNLNRSTFYDVISANSTIGPIVPVDDIITQPVPSPRVMWLLAIGIAEIAALRRRKRD
jgi:hypothetical protein